MNKCTLCKKWKWRLRLTEEAGDVTSSGHVEEVKASKNIKLCQIEEDIETNPCATFGDISPMAHFYFRPSSSACTVAIRTEMNVFYAMSDYHHW